ncbi:MAG: hypothetical protein ACERKZ_21450 [Lachnotalea sp.]
MADNSSKLEIDGFVFSSRHDTIVAENELKGVEYLKKKTNMKNPRMVLVVYNKMVAEGLFQTQIGISYVRELQKFLIESQEIDNNSIADIPVEPLHAGISKKNMVDRIAHVFSNSRKAYRDRLKMAIITNFILGAIIVAMFVISTTSNNPNILNYEEKITDKYAAWDQELTERENALNNR